MTSCVRCGGEFMALHGHQKTCNRCKAASGSRRYNKAREQQICRSWVEQWAVKHGFELRWGVEYEYRGGVCEEKRADRCEGSLRNGVFRRWVRFSVNKWTKRAEMLARLHYQKYWV